MPRIPKGANAPSDFEVGAVWQVQAARHRGALVEIVRVSRSSITCRPARARQWSRSQRTNVWTIDLINFLRNHRPLRSLGEEKGARGS